MPPGFVALDEVDVLVDVVVVGVLLELLVLVEVVVVGELEVVEVLLVVLDAVVGVQSDTSWLIVEAPWPRLDSNVRLTDDGRSATALLSAVAALEAWEHWWERSADEMVFSWADRVEDWSDESSPLELPQATAKAAANPRPPARNAREPMPIRPPTLEAAPVCLTLRGPAPTGKRYWPYCRRSASESGRRAARIAAAAPAMS